MSNFQRILSKYSTRLRGCCIWSKKLHFGKNFDANFIVVEWVLAQLAKAAIIRLCIPTQHLVRAKGHRDCFQVGLRTSVLIFFYVVGFKYNNPSGIDKLFHLLRGCSRLPNNWYRAAACFLKDERRTVVELIWMEFLFRSAVEKHTIFQVEWRTATWGLRLPKERRGGWIETHFHSNTVS